MKSELDFLLWPDDLEFHPDVTFMVDWTFQSKIS